MLHKKTIVICFLLISSFCFAQVNKNKLLSLKEGWSAGINTYTVSPGIVANKQLIKNKLQVSIGGNFLRMPFPQYVSRQVNVPDSVNVIGDFDFGRIFISTNYTFWKSVGVVAGLQYNIFKANVNLSMTKDYSTQFYMDFYGNKEPVTVIIPKEAVGELNIQTTGNPVAGIMAITVGNKISNKKISVNCELGMVVQGTLNAKVEDKYILVDAGSNGSYNFYLNGDEGVKKTIDDYHTYLERFAVFPYISFSLSYKIS